MRSAAAEAAIVTAADGGIFSRRSAPVGMVSAAHVLGAIAKNVIDKAPMKIMSGHRDLGFNVPITPCQRNCPIRQDIATYIDYVSQGRYVDSWAVIHETNPFPSMLGRLCNHPCETDCKRGWDPGEEPVTIKSIKRFSTDFAFQQGLWINYKIAPAKGKRVAVVGAGPAGPHLRARPARAGIRRRALRARGEGGRPAQHVDPAVPLRSSPAPVGAGHDHDDRDRRPPQQQRRQRPRRHQDQGSARRVRRGVLLDRDDEGPHPADPGQRPPRGHRRDELPAHRVVRQDP